MCTCTGGERRFELRLVVLDVPVPLLQGHLVTLHAHAAREEGRISALVASLDPKVRRVAWGCMQHVDLYKGASAPS